MTTEMQSEDGTVLLVDDEQGLADLYAVWVEEVCTVRTAYDGEQALGLMGEDVDAVLLDRRMPGLSGDTVLEEFRDRGFTQPVAMLTAIDPGFEIVGMDIDEYYLKPINDSAVFRSAVTSLINRGRYRESVREYFAILSKKVALETTKNPQELESSDAYAGLKRQLQRAEERSGDALTEMTATDAFARFRDV